MRRIPRRLGRLMIAIAVVAALCAGAVKARQHARLRDQIAAHRQLEDRLMQEYRSYPKTLRMCGMTRQRLDAILAVAAEQRALREHCERRLRRFW